MLLDSYWDVLCGFCQINALCMAFYARSEEARQTHSVHKLALVGSVLFSIVFT